MGGRRGRGREQGGAAESEVGRRAPRMRAPSWTPPARPQAAVGSGGSHTALLAAGSPVPRGPEEEVASIPEPVRQRLLMGPGVSYEGCGLRWKNRGTDTLPTPGKGTPRPLASSPLSRCRCPWGGFNRDRPLQKVRRAEVLTPRASECDLLWKYNHCGCDRLRRSYRRRAGPRPMRLASL